jgi:hypothetical protein
MFASLVAHQHLPDTKIDDLYKQLRPYAPEHLPSSLASAAGGACGTHAATPILLPASASDKLRDLDEEFERTMLRFETRMPSLRSSALSAPPAAGSGSPLGAQQKPDVRPPRLSQNNNSAQKTGSPAGSSSSPMAALNVAEAVRREVFELTPITSTSSPARRARPSSSERATSIAASQSAITASSSLPGGSSLRGRVVAGYATVEDGRNATAVADAVATRLDRAPIQYSQCAFPGTASSVKPATPQQQQQQQLYHQSSPLDSSEYRIVEASYLSSAPSPEGHAELQAVNQSLRRDNDRLRQQLEAAKVDGARREENLAQKIAELERTIRSRDNAAAYGSSSTEVISSSVCVQLEQQVRVLEAAVAEQREIAAMAVSVSEEVASLAVEIVTRHSPSFSKQVKSQQQ